MNLTSTEFRRGWPVLLAASVGTAFGASPVPFNSIGPFIRPLSAEFGPVQGLGIPFMLVGPFIAVLCVIIYVITSLLTPAMDPKEVAKVCWDHPLAFLKGRFAGASDPRLVTLILVVVVGILYFLLR